MTSPELLGNLSRRSRAYQLWYALHPGVQTPPPTYTDAEVNLILDVANDSLQQPESHWYLADIRKRVPLPVLRYVATGEVA